MIVLYIILGVIALFLLAGLVISKDISATKEIVINKPVGEVFNYIKYLKNQQNYSKWATLDPNMKNEFIGTDGQPGFINRWSGNKKVGEGEQEIIAIEEGKSISTELRFVKPFRSQASAKMSVKGNGGGGTTTGGGGTTTIVVWAFASKMNYPMNVMKLFMNMSEAVGKDFAIGLANLKTVMEK